MSQARVTTGGPGPNADAIVAWDTLLFDKWVRFRHVVHNGLGAHGPAAFDRLGSIAKQRVLDLGCGFGDSTQELAKRVGPDGEVVGVDCARRFIESAAAEARDAQVDNARFGVRDVQTDDLGGPFDLAFSRFGTMFFASPVQALKNIRSSLRDSGTLCLVVWRKREDNPCFHTAEIIVKKMVTIPAETDAPTCGPGPFSMSGADLVSDQLIKAGFKKITFVRNDLDIMIGRDVDDAIEFALAIGPAGEDLRLSGEDGEKKKPQIVDALRDGLAPFVRPDGSVYAPSSTWIITAAC
jgi:SAM-dependent methyltransferase